MLVWRYIMGNTWCACDVFGWKYWPVVDLFGPVSSPLSLSPITAFLAFVAKNKTEEQNTLSDTATATTTGSTTNLEENCPVLSPNEHAAVPLALVVDIKNNKAKGTAACSFGDKTGQNEHAAVPLALVVDIKNNNKRTD